MKITMNERFRLLPGFIGPHDASPSLGFALRSTVCELLISWAMKVAPSNYIPSAVQAILDTHLEYRRQAEKRKL